MGALEGAHKGPRGGPSIQNPTPPFLKILKIKKKRRTYTDSTIARTMRSLFLGSLVRTIVEFVDVLCFLILSVYGSHMAPDEASGRPVQSDLPRNSPGALRGPPDSPPRLSGGVQGGPSGAPPGNCKIGNRSERWSAGIDFALESAHK